jgi:hypothetical protein
MAPGLQIARLKYINDKSHRSFYWRGHHEESAFSAVRRAAFRSGAGRRYDSPGLQGRPGCLVSNFYVWVDGPITGCGCRTPASAFMPRDPVHSWMRGQSRPSKISWTAPACAVHLATSCQDLLYAWSSVAPIFRRMDHRSRPIRHRLCLPSPQCFSRAEVRASRRVAMSV